MSKGSRVVSIKPASVKPADAPFETLLAELKADGLWDDIKGLTLPQLEAYLRGYQRGVEKGAKLAEPSL